MQPRFGIFDEELIKYLINFSLARQSLISHKHIPEEIMDYLAEMRLKGLPEKAFKKEQQQSLANLESRIELIYRQVTRATPVIEESQEKITYSFMHDPSSKIQSIEYRVKDYRPYWVKFLRNVLTQNMTGFYDFRKARIIVETPQATEFRMFRPYENLTDEERKKYSLRFGRKGRDKLSADEKEEYIREFGREFSGLTEAEKKQYHDRFGELNRKKCLDVGIELANNVSWSTIPVTPHYLDWEGIKFRSQTQHVLDYYGKPKFEITYSMLENRQDMSRFTENITRRYKGSNDGGNRAIRYKDAHNRDCYMLGIADNLIINFYSETELGNEIINKIAEIVSQKYENSAKITSTTKFLENLRLNMNDLGLFIYSETNSDDLTTKFRGAGIDTTKSKEMFLRTYMEYKDEHTRTDRGYESVHLYLGDKQTVMEIQIRDPEMHYTAERGSASHSEYEKEREQKEGITKEDMEIGNLFFGRKKQDKERFNAFYRDNLVGRIQSIKEAVFGMRNIAGSDKEFQERISEMTAVYGLAKKVLPKDASEIVKKTLNTLTEDYMLDMGGECLANLNDILYLNRQFMLINRKTRGGIGLKYLREEFLLEKVHMHYLSSLYSSFEEAIESNSKSGTATAFCIAELIKNYGKFYGQKHTPHSHSEYIQKIEEKFKGIIKENKWVEDNTSPVGYIPGFFVKKVNGNEFYRKLNPRSIEGFLSSKARGVTFDRATLWDINSCCNELKQLIGGGIPYEY